VSDDTFHRVIRQYAAPLARVAASYARHDSQQEDLLQEIYFALWKALPTFRGESRELTFVLSVAHNRGITYAARLRRSAFLSLPESTPDPNPSPDGEFERRERVDSMYEAMQRLPDAQRQAMMLHLEGLSGKEIAAVQGTTENNVNVRLNRARARLRALVGESEGNIE
jgi:RNA polymerase sigma-70 factor (ECF subfamily)